jgi:disulfide oxidoreductase YuzD
MRLTKAWLKEALERCFQNQPLIYEVIDKTIVVKDKLLTSSQTTPLPIS